ncbi:YczE/YyaS/YitT family protein [Lacrimispora celerecrescens]|uniref:YitT family protein n=1 Tax=[Clostridium] celerecrescens 18A TaxID=1286362 RepID=A0A2M8YZU0_9FIRM|nr:DUF6198 family protein [Lacrimispora celerecrescens]PJJ26704.1 hypothetical protein H171_0144 [[Clostridium] celerecrescens 18A]
MKNSDMFKRYGLFIAGVIFSALGISLITKAGLGTSPITSLAFVLTFIFPESLGVFTMMVNFAMFLLQAVLLGKTFKKIQLLQLPAALLFSLCIDVWMYLLSFWKMGNYLGEALMLLFGCVFLGFGISLEVIPNVLILPGEGLVRVIAGLTGWRFGRVKTGFDLSIVISAVIVSVLVTGSVLGIREGTVIAALIVGSISNFFIDKVSGLLAGWIPAYTNTKDVCL